jgi:hypothetical protein
MEQEVNQFSRKIRRFYKKFNSFPSHKKIFVILMLLLALPFTVYLVRTFKLYLSQAATAQLTFSPSSASLPPNSTLSVRANSGSAQIAFARVEVTFDNTKVNLSNEIQVNGPLAVVIGKTTRANANSTGRVVVVMALCNGIDIPCAPSAGAPTPPSGTFQLFTLPFTSITNQTTTATISYDVGASQLVDTAQSSVTLTGVAATLSLNSGSGATNTITPTRSPNATTTPTRRPNTATPTRAPNATATPTTRPNQTATPQPTGNVTQPDTTLSLTSSQTSIAVNQSLPVNVAIATGANRVIGVDLDITFDPASFELLDITPGSFFTNPDVANKVIDNTGGHAQVTIATPPGSTARQGSGTLAILNFRAIGQGITRIDFGDGNLVAATNTNGQDALRTVTGLGITVTQSTLQGDINQDGTVDIVDYVILFANFGKRTNTPGADARADINHDGNINILDYSFLFENFGRSI